MSTWKAVGIGLLSLVVVVALAFGGRELGWWLKADNVNRQVKIDNTNVGTQTAWRDEVNELMNTVELLPEGASQRGGLINQACEEGIQQDVDGLVGCDDPEKTRTPH